MKTEFSLAVLASLAVSSAVSAFSVSSLSSLSAPQQSHRQGRGTDALLAVQSQDTEIEARQARCQGGDTTVTARQARILLPLAVASVSWHADSRGAAALQSTPEAFERSRTQFFSGCLASSVIVLRVAGTLRKRGFFPYNTMIAACTSADELNDVPGGLVNGLRTKMTNTDTGVFRFGDTNGMPSNGELDEFVRHSPKDGRLLVVLAPNIGIDKDGTVGRVERFGQDESSLSSTFLWNVGASSDVISKMVVQRMKDRAGKDRMADAVQALYDVGKESIDRQLKAVLSQPGVWERTKEIVFLGGIIVQRGRGSGLPKGEDYFQPLTMTSYTVSGASRLYDDVFGDLSTPRDRV